MLQAQNHNVVEDNSTGDQVALFGGGCFWGLELMFQRMEGVTKTKVGYAQGHLENPTYNDVKKGTTGHAEVVQVRKPSMAPLFWGSLHEQNVLRTPRG